MYVLNTSDPHLLTASLEIPSKSNEKYWEEIILWNVDYIESNDLKHLMEILEEKDNDGSNNILQYKNTRPVHTGVSVIGQYVKRKINFYCI